MLFDTHAHYDDEAFDEDRDELMRLMPECGVGLIIIPGCELSSSRRAVAMSKKFAHVYSAVGFHPEELDQFSEEDFAETERLALDEKCVAIGEIGLDYYWDDTHKQKQKQLLRRQIELALRLDKPVIIHDREAHGDTMEIICDYPALRGVFHCYSGSAEMAKELLRRGWYLGFDGPITYKNARKTAEVLALCPLDRMLIETDSPYLSPVPMRGKRNDSRNLVYTLARLAEIKGLSTEQAEALTTENGRRLFSI